MEVVKELTVCYEDGVEYRYTLGDDDYRLEEGRAHLRLWKNGCTYSIHYFEDSGKYRVKEYYIRNVVVPKGGPNKVPVDEVEKFKEVSIFFPHSVREFYKDVSLEILDDRIKLKGEGTVAVFLLKNISGWEVWEE